MPDDEHKLTIRIETNAGDAAKDMERLDEAQQNVRQSGEKLQETERHGSTVDARKARQRAKFMRAYLRDIKAIRQNTEKTNKSIAALNKSEKVAERGEQRTIKNSGLMLKRILAVAAAIAVLKRAFNSLGEGLNFGKNYLLAGMLTGTDAVRAQMWERLLKPFGGNLGSAAAGLGNIQRNIALANMGEMPFNDMAFRLLGDAIMTRPGMTQKDFLRNIAPRMQSLSRGEALLAGQSVGLPDDMSLMLNKFGAAFESELEKQRQAAMVSQKKAEEAQKNRQKFDDILQGMKDQVLEIANAIFRYLPDNPKMLQALGKILTGVTIIGGALMGFKMFRWFFKPGTPGAPTSIPKNVPPSAPPPPTPPPSAKVPFPNLGPISAGLLITSIGAALAYLLHKGARDAQEEKWSLPEKSAPFDPTKNLPKGPMLPQKFVQQTSTPLNGMGQQAAFAAGYQAGLSAITNNNGNTVTTGDIIINAPSGDAQDIAREVGSVLDSFANLDRLNATQYYA